MSKTSRANEAAFCATNIKGVMKRVVSYHDMASMETELNAANDRIEDLERMSADKIKNLRDLNAELSAAIMAMREALKQVSEHGCQSCQASMESSLINEYQHQSQCFLHKALSLTPHDALREWLEPTIKTLKFICERENLTFAECSVAEEIVERAKQELSRLTGGKG